jgi:hypothetical protein
MNKLLIIWENTCEQKIVADMRKVIANHPEIEQKRLHRRVFFDYINSQNNLALMVSSFLLLGIWDSESEDFSLQFLVLVRLL